MINTNNRTNQHLTINPRRPRKSNKEINPSFPIQFPYNGYIAPVVQDHRSPQQKVNASASQFHHEEKSGITKRVAQIQKVIGPYANFTADGKGPNQCQEYMWAINSPIQRDSGEMCYCFHDDCYLFEFDNLSKDYVVSIADMARYVGEHFPGDIDQTTGKLVKKATWYERYQHSSHNKDKTSTFLNNIGESGFRHQRVYDNGECMSGDWNACCVSYPNLPLCRQVPWNNDGKSAEWEQWIMDGRQGFIPFIVNNQGFHPTSYHAYGVQSNHPDQWSNQKYRNDPWLQMMFQGNMSQWVQYWDILFDPFFDLHELGPVPPKNDDELHLWFRQYIRNKQNQQDGAVHGTNIGGSNQKLRTNIRSNHYRPIQNRKFLPANVGINNIKKHSNRTAERRVFSADGNKIIQNKIKKMNKQ